LTSPHLFFECTLLEQARAELPSSNKDIRFHPDMVAHVVSDWRKNASGVGFSCYPKHRVLEPDLQMRVKMRRYVTRGVISIEIQMVKIKKNKTPGVS
jgi:hypothetical protein